jgi:hypothetical protein
LIACVGLDAAGLSPGFVPKDGRIAKDFLAEEWPPNLMD